jgi:hypothetical protein
MALLGLVGFVLVGCGAADPSETGEPGEDVSAESDEALRIVVGPSRDVLDCKEKPDCWECGNVNGSVCCVYDPCTVINKPKLVLMQSASSSSDSVAP